MASGAEFLTGPSGGPSGLMLGPTGANSYIGAQKHEDPLIKAEIDKNLKEQKKLLEQDFARSLEEIDKNFELKKQEILK
jgi:myosin heavy subunit